MTLQVTGFHSATLDYKIVYESASSSTASVNVTGTTGTLYSIDVDNQANSGVFLKIHDGAAPTVGTTAPDMIFHIPASTNNTKKIDIPGGWPFTTGLNFWTVTGDATSNTAAPAGGNVLVTLVTS